MMQFGTFRLFRLRVMIASLALLGMTLAALTAFAPEADACRDYDGHRNWVVPPDCGYAGSFASGGSSVDVAIDAAELPYVFHSIAERESGDDPTAVNPAS